MEATRVVVLPPQKTVFSPGALCENYLLVIEGSVRTHLLTESGREVVLYHVRPGESCVLTTSCLIGHTRYPAEGVTEKQVTALVVPAEVFHTTLDHSAVFRRFVFDNLAHRLADVMARMEEVAFGSIQARLAQALLDSDQNPVQTTHQELAAELGTAREVVSRHLKRFEERGWLRLGRGLIQIVDREAIARHLDTY